MSPEDVAKILDELGQRIGPASNHIFEITVRQTYINALQVLGVFLVSTLCLSIWTKLYVREWITNWNTNTFLLDEQFKVLWTLGHTILGFILVVVVGFSLLSILFGSVISSLLNPEYAAMRTLVEMITAK